MFETVQNVVNPWCFMKKLFVRITLAAFLLLSPAAVVLSSLPVYAEEVTYYWVGNGGDLADAENHWATESGGTPNAANIPDEFTNIVFDEESVTIEGQTITNLTEAIACKNFTITGLANSPFMDLSYVYTYGSFFSNSSFLNSLVVIFSGSGDITCEGGNGPIAQFTTHNTFTGNLTFVNTSTFNGDIYIRGGNCNFGTSAINAPSSGDIYFETTGVIDFGSSEVDMEVGSISCLSTGTVNFNNSSINIGGSIVGSAGVYFGNATITSSLISIDTFVDFGSATITTTSSSLDIWLGASDGIDFGSAIITCNEMLITSPSTIDFDTATFNINSLYFEAEKTYILTSFPIAGSFENTIVLGSYLYQEERESYINQLGDSFHLSIPSGVISCDYLNITNSHTNGGAAWYAGNNSINGGGNEGWIFTSPPAAPSAPTNFLATQTYIDEATLTWTMGADSVNTVIRVKIGAYPASVTDGYEEYNGDAVTFTRGGLDFDQHGYFWRAWGEADGSYSADYAQGTLGGENVAALATAFGNFNALLLSIVMLGLAGGFVFLSKWLRSTFVTIMAGFVTIAAGVVTASTTEWEFLVIGVAIVAVGLYLLIMEGVDLLKGG
jgi:hypothetical protein